VGQKSKRKRNYSSKANKAMETRDQFVDKFRVMLDTRVKRYTCGSKLLNAGLAGDTRFFKDKDLTLVMLNNWPPVMRNCELYVLS
jgi:hypothetical protein